jgi:hypothetical protein
MGQMNANASSDRAVGRLTGTFAAAGQSPGIEVAGVANLALWGNLTATSLVIKLQKSYDFGTTWIDVARDTSGTLLQFTTVTASGVSVRFEESEPGVQYRLDCSGSTFAGTANYRISY